MLSKAIPYEGSDPYLFLILDPEDAERLAPLIDYLDNSKLRIWYDAGSQDNTDRLDNTENHLEDCRAAIAFVTEAFSLSHDCKSAVISAMKCRRKVLPVLIGNPPLPKGLRMQLGRLNFLSRSDFDSDEELMAKLCKAPECQACRTDIAPEPVIPVIPVSDVPEIKTTNTDSGTSDQQKADPPAVIGRLAARLFPKGTEGETRPKPEFHLPAFLRKQPRQEEAPESEVPQDTRAAEEAPKPPVSVTEPQPARKELYVSSESSTPAASVTDPQPARKELYVSSESSHPAASVTAPQPARKELYVSSESSAPAASVAQGPDPDTIPTVLDRRKPAPEVSGQSADNDVTILIHNRVTALLFHVRAGRAYTLRKPQTKLGRSPIKCDVVLEGNDSISKLHAELRCYNQKFFLLDAGSKNGTYLQGEQLSAGSQVQLPNPACFHLNNEPMILATGDTARAITAAGYAALLVNSDSTNALLLDSDVTRLNRSSKWFDGTLNDPSVHRAAHAQIRRFRNDYYLVDESPEHGNGTCVNEYTLRHGEARRLNSGDIIRLGDTALSFVTIQL